MRNFGELYRGTRPSKPEAALGGLPIRTSGKLFDLVEGPCMFQDLALDVESIILMEKISWYRHGPKVSQFSVPQLFRLSYGGRRRTALLLRTADRDQKEQQHLSGKPCIGIFVPSQMIMTRQLQKRFAADCTYAVSKYESKIQRRKTQRLELQHSQNIP